MALTHITFGHGSPHGALLDRGLKGLEDGREALNDTIACMVQMIDGNGTDPAHFVYMQGKFGFTTTADAKAAYEELLSLASKLNTDNTVSSVQAALLQAFAKFR